MANIHDGPQSALFTPLALQGGGTFEQLAAAAISAQMAGALAHAPRGACVGWGIPFDISAPLVVAAAPVSVSFVPALARAPLAVEAGDDAAEAQWKSVYRLPVMAFDHNQILDYALKRLRYKLEYSAAGFQLLPPAFTLSDLQQAYEIVLGEQLDKRNFRRRILQAAVIEPTGAHRSHEGRPARLYRFRADAVAEVKARRLFP